MKDWSKHSKNDLNLDKNVLHTLKSDAMRNNFLENSGIRLDNEYNRTQYFCPGSIFASIEPYEAKDNHMYNTFSKDIDAHLALADMESFRTEDIHALFSNLPAMHTYQLSDETPIMKNRESAASISTSLIDALQIDSSDLVSNSDNDGDSNSNSLSICKSEILFSPVKEMHLPTVNFSVDSLDCDMLLTCKANKNNYTIAFEESSLLDGSFTNAINEASDRNVIEYNFKKKNQNKRYNINHEAPNSKENGATTTWGEIKQKHRNMINVQSTFSDTYITTQSNRNTFLTKNIKSISSAKSLIKSQSLPNIAPSLSFSLQKKIKNDQSTFNYPVKIFNLSRCHNISTESSSTNMHDSKILTSSKTGEQHSLNLVQRFMSHKKSNDSLCGPVQTSNDSLILENLNDGVIQKKIDISKSIDKQKVTSKQDIACSHNMKESEAENGSPVFSEMRNLSYKGCQKHPEKDTYKVIQFSYLDKLKTEGKVEKPVYVLFPNYVLPNLDFLSNQPNKDSNIHLLSHKHSKIHPFFYKRRYSCTDFDTLIEKGFDHITDWESLNTLLPKEYRNYLSQLPELQNNLNTLNSKESKLSGPCKYQKNRPISCDLTALNQNSTNSSIATQPSSGYRGSSTILNDPDTSPWYISANPLFVYRYESASNSELSSALAQKQGAGHDSQSNCKHDMHPDGNYPRPLMRRILKKNVQDTIFKRRSLPEPYYLQRNRHLLDIKDDLEEVSVQQEETKLNLDTPNDIKNEELSQLQKFLQDSKVDSASNDGSEHLDSLRSYVGKFMALNLNKDNIHIDDKLKLLKCPVPNNSPNCSTFVTCHTKQNKMHNTTAVNNSISSCIPLTSPIQEEFIFVNKEYLLKPVLDAVDDLTSYFATASNEYAMKTFGNSIMNPKCAQLVLNLLCPALYAFLCDGLKTSIDTSFGPVNNSMWQVVEASANQGTLTKALNDLVLRINSEESINEGVVKFNAFIFGLLNVGALDAWVTYLKTRESILNRHYTNDSLFVRYHKSGSKVRSILDKFINSLKQLSALPFDIDILFEYRLLHSSLDKVNCSEYRQLHTVQQAQPSRKTIRNKSRPRSCIIDRSDHSKPQFNVNDVIKKRWSGIPLNSKMYLAYEKLTDDENNEYDNKTRLLNNELNGEQNIYDNRTEIEAQKNNKANYSTQKTSKGCAFNRAQQKWDKMCIEKEQIVNPRGVLPSPTKSKIPRPISLYSNYKENTKCASNSSASAKKPNSPVIRKISPPSSAYMKQYKCVGSRRIPEKPHTLGIALNNEPSLESKNDNSTSTIQHQEQTNIPTLRYVVTISNKINSENGHLPFRKGERLHVVMEVDDDWFLCSRGSTKGLVQKSAVIMDTRALQIQMS